MNVNYKAWFLMAFKLLSCELILIAYLLLRLHYFARSVQGYMKKLQEALRGKTGDELKSEENKLKVVALKTTSNINTLIKDLFHTPPSFKSNIALSWKPASASYTNVSRCYNVIMLCDVAGEVFI